MSSHHHPHPPPLPLPLHHSLIPNPIPQLQSPHSTHPPSDHDASLEIAVKHLKTVPSFLKKLYCLTHDPTLKDYVQWNAQGDIFGLYNHKDLASQVFPKVFNHCKFTSFTRQMNIYCFQRVTATVPATLQDYKPNGIFYQNPYFRRNQPNLLVNIKRKVAGSSKEVNSTSLTDERANFNVADEDEDQHIIVGLPLNSQTSISTVKHLESRKETFLPGSLANEPINFEAKLSDLSNSQKTWMNTAQYLNQVGESEIKPVLSGLDGHLGQLNGVMAELIGVLEQSGLDGSGKLRHEYNEYSQKLNTRLTLDDFIQNREANSTYKPSYQYSEMHAYAGYSSQPPFPDPSAMVSYPQDQCHPAYNNGYPDQTHLVDSSIYPSPNDFSLPRAHQHENSAGNDWTPISLAAERHHPHPPQDYMSPTFSHPHSAITHSGMQHHSYPYVSAQSPGYFPPPSTDNSFSNPFNVPTVSGGLTTTSMDSYPTPTHHPHSTANLPSLRNPDSLKLPPLPSWMQKLNQLNHFSEHGASADEFDGDFDEDILVDNYEQRGLGQGVSWDS